MASHPPFNSMEDQTDEDFFDKLVDDDFGPAVSSDSVPKLTEGSDSDEAKAFADLSIEDKGEKDPVRAGIALSCVDGGEVNTLETMKDVKSDGGIGLNESDNAGIGSEVVLDTAASNGNVTMKSGVKEVGWTSFYSDSIPNGDHGFGSYSDFFNDLGNGSENFSEKVDENVGVDNRASGGLEKLDSTVSQEQYQDGSQQVYGGFAAESANGQDSNSSQYWENMYPGWKYDANTGQWYQVDGYDATVSTQGSFDTNSGSEWAAVSDGKTETEVNYLQLTSQSAVGTVAETSTTESVSSWKQVPEANNSGYPEHMVFDPQYPGWYYDTIVQEWRTLESYTSSMQSVAFDTHDQQNQNGFAFNGLYSQDSSSSYSDYGQVDKYGSHNFNGQGQHGSWGESYGNYNQQDLNMWQPENVAKANAVSDAGGLQQLQHSYSSNISINNHADQQGSFNSFGAAPSYGKASQGNIAVNGFIGPQNFVPGGQQFNQTHMEQNEQVNFSNDYYGTQKPISASQQSFQSNQQFSYNPNMGRSSAGRPPSALVTFGFGGKLIVMKDSSSSGSSAFGSQDTIGGSVSVLNLLEVLSESAENASSIGGSTCNYFRALCQQSFPGPLVGGNVGSKELGKWIDERITNCESPDMDYRKGEVLRLLLSLLKISCQHYGKLRSPFGADTSLRENDSPESAVAKLFASAKRNGTQFTEYGALSHCVQNLPSEGQIRATASEVQNLLVSGRKKEALQCAQEGQLWGPALVLASQLGDQFYVDTVKQMALRQLVAGSPLRTLCLLIAGQPADVFASNTTTDGNLPAPVNLSQQPAQFGHGMLDDWEENLAVITANRTKDDELVIIHLGDCLWKDRSEITAAHICYLVAEANFESYSDTARLCLIGADHWKHPRTYASPDAIQRTELYEYSKVLGNSQFILLPFQPYKLIYAYMLAEVGKVSDSLKYCQALLRSLKTGRSPEVETWKQLVLSLEERIRTHQQGGYSANLAPTKLVGKLLNFFDSTAHRVVGGLPPPALSTLQGSIQGNEHHSQQMAPRVSASQSAMAMSSLMPSASMEPINEWSSDNNRMAMHNRSVSEPDFGRTPRQVDSSKDGPSSSAQGKPPVSGGASRFARFGFGTQLLQKTVGLVLRPRSDRQAKLGETNKFYYDEKLKRWVEEGAEPPAEEAALAPPPLTTAVFQNGTPDYNLKSALKSDMSPPNGSPTFKSPMPSEHALGTPPIPTSSNQFSARGRMGVRARYVDTFNQGGGSTANFQSPAIPSVRPAVAANAKFFVPTPAPLGEYSMGAIAENMQEDTAASENPSTSTTNESFENESFHSHTSSPMERFPSMDNISRMGVVANGNGPVPSHSRTASWSGSFSESFSPPKMGETKPLGEALGMPPSSFLPVDPSVSHMMTNGGSLGEDLHEVEL